MVRWIEALELNYFLTYHRPPTPLFKHSRKFRLCASLGAASLNCSSVHHCTMIRKQSQSSSPGHYSATLSMSRGDG